MKIAIVCDGIGDVVAGSFISTARFAELLTARGHSIVFVSSGRFAERGRHEFRGMTVHRLPGVLIPWSDGQLYLALPMARAIRRILEAERADVVHVMVPMPLGLIAARIARSMGTPVVMHSHTQPENIFMSSPRFPGFDRVFRRFCAYLNWIYRQADVMIYPSEFSKRQFPELIDRPHAVISNGVDGRRFQATCPDAFMRRFGLSRTNQNLLYLGRLHREKNVDTLVRAMPRIVSGFPDAHLCIVGMGYDLEVLQDLARRCGVAAHVTFCGFVPDDDLPAAYSAADLFVLPSLAELEGMAVLEAMACGKPLLIADSPNSAAVDFVHGNGLLFRAQDPDHLAAQACTLLSNPEGLREMGARSLETSRHFDIRQSVSALESVYLSLVARA